MKRTLALLIAVLMVAVMLPATVLTAAAQGTVDALEALDSIIDNADLEAEPNPGSTADDNTEPVPVPDPTPEDYFQVLDEKGQHVDYYATLAEADAALQDGYTLKLLQSVEATEAYIFGVGRAEAKHDTAADTGLPISYTIDGGFDWEALAAGETDNLITYTGAWVFNYLSDGDTITVKNLAIGNQGDGESTVTVDMETTAASITFENCMIVASAGVALAVNSPASKVSFLGENAMMMGNDYAVVTNAFTVIDAATVVSEQGEAAVRALSGATVALSGGVYMASKTAVVEIEEYATVLVHGGMYMLDGLVESSAASIGAFRMEGMCGLMLAEASIIVPAAAKLAGDADDVYSRTTGIWGVDADSADAAVLLGNVMANYGIQGGFVNPVTTPQMMGLAESGTEMPIPGAEAGTVSGYMLQTALPADIAAANVTITVPGEDGDELYAAFTVTSIDEFYMALMAAPANATVNMLTDFPVADNSTFIFNGTPIVSGVTINGNGHTLSFPAATDYGMGFAAWAEVTVENMNIVSNAGALTLSNNAVLTLGEGVTVTANGKAAAISGGATLNVLEGATLNGLVDMAGNATFNMLGGALVAPNEAGVAVFSITDATVQKTVDTVTLSYYYIPTINIEAGVVTTPAGPSQLVVQAINTSSAKLTVLPGVRFLAANNAEDTEGFVVAENPVELLDENGEHVGYYASLVDAAADLADGYTIQLLADHIETKPAEFKGKDLSWTLEGNGFDIYLPELNYQGFEIGGTKQTVYLNDFTLYSAGFGLFVFATTTTSEVVVKANDVFVFAAGATDTNATSYVGDPQRVAAIRVETKGANLSITGEKSGAYVNGNGVAFTHAIYNTGYLAIQNGTYMADADYLLETVGTHAGGNGNDHRDHVITYLGGGTFVNKAETGRWLTRTYGGATTVFMGGDYVHFGTQAPIRITETNGSSQPWGGQQWIFGGRFYSATPYYLVCPQWTVNYTQIYGGSFYGQNKDGTTGAWLTGRIDSAKKIIKNESGQEFYYGVYMGEHLTVNVGETNAYTASEANGDPALTWGKTYTAEHVVENDTWLTSNGYTKGQYTFKAYSTTPDDENAAVYGFYMKDDVANTAFLQLMTTLFVAAGIEGTIELQRDIKVAPTATFYTRYLGAGSNVKITSADNAPEGYYTFKTSYGYMIFFMGGTYTFTDVTFVNTEGSLFNIRGGNYSTTTLVAGKGAEFSSFNTTVFNSRSHLIVEQGAFLNFVGNNAGAYSDANQIVRTEGACRVDVYGTVGYNRDGSINTNGSFTALTFRAEIAADDIRNTTDKITVIRIHSGAAITGANNTVGNNPLLWAEGWKDSAVDYANDYNVHFIVDDGAVLQSNFNYVDMASATHLKMGNAKLYSASVSYLQNPTACEQPVLRTKTNGRYYAIVLRAAHADVSNLTFEGDGFFLFTNDQDQSATRRITAKFTNCYVITYAKTMDIKGGNMFVEFYGDNGYYETRGKTQFAIFTANGLSTPAGGHFAIYGGTFCKLDATQGMTKIGGSHNILIAGGLVETDQSTIFSWGEGSSGTFTVTGGTIRRDGWFSLLTTVEENNGIAIRIEGGRLEVNRSTNASGTYPVENHSMFILRGPTTLDITGGELYTGCTSTAIARMIYAYNSVEINVTGGRIIGAHNYTGGDSKSYASVFYMRDTSVLNISGNAYIEASASGKISSNRFSVIEAVDKARVNITGGTIRHLNGGFMGIASRNEAVITISGSNTYIESNGINVAGTDWGATDGTEITTPSTAQLNIYGGTFVLQPVYHYRVDSAEASVITTGTATTYGTVNIYGGIFINNRDTAGETASPDTSAQVIRKANVCSTLNITGGVFLATSIQSYFYHTDGNAAGGKSYPVMDVAVLPGTSPMIHMMGRDYYYFAYSQGNPMVPELKAKLEVRLHTNEGTGEAENGLLFTSYLSAVHYEALLSWVDLILDQKGITGVSAEDVLTYGTLIAPAENLITTNGKFDPALFDAEGLAYIDVPATANGITIDGNGLAIRAALVGIEADHYETQYAALPYMVISIPIVTPPADPNGTPTVDYETYTLYGSLNTNRGVNSLASVAARALADVMAVPVAPYLYKSLSVAHAYSRYSKAQQETLMSYVTHEHVYDHTGACTVGECGLNIGTQITADVATTVYCEIEGVRYMNVALKAGVSYNFAFGNDTLVKYALYDAQGNVMSVVDDKFACAADGTYYLVVTSRGTGSTTLTVAHVHQAGHVGYCTVCQTDLSVTVNVEELYELLVVKGNTYYYNVQLTGGVSYTIITANGLFTVYDAAGNAGTVTNSIYTAPADGTYYIVVNATISAKGSIHIQHVHAYDHTGTCSVAGCGDYVGQSTTVYPASSARPGGRLESGDMLYLNISLKGGETYKVYTTTFLGVYDIYNAAGEKQTVGNDGFVCPADGTYYVVFTVQTNATGYVYVGRVHECDYNHKGICRVCSKNIGVGVTERNDIAITYTEGARYYFHLMVYKGITYHFTFPENTVTYRIHGQSETPISNGFDRENNTYTVPDNDRILYIVVDVLATNSSSRVFGVMHEHKYDYKGECQAPNCTDSQLQSIKNFNTNVNASYEKDGTYYYGMFLTAEHMYAVQLNNLNASWVLLDAEGNEVHNSTTGGTYAPAETGQFILVVSATETSSGTIRVTDHEEHTLNNKGVCTVGGCNYSETGVMSVGTTPLDGMPAGTYYAGIQLNSGSTYSFALTDGATATWKLFAPDGETEVVLTEGEFFCDLEQGGIYYLVLVVSEALGDIDAIITEEVHTEHALNFKGECAYDNCNYTEGVDVSTMFSDTSMPMSDMAAGKYYAYFTARVGYNYLFEIALTEKASVALYDANGQPVALAENVFYCDEDMDGVYYIVLTVAEADDNNAYIFNETLHTAHALDNKGECTIGDCTHSECLALTFENGVAQPCPFPQAGTYYVALTLEANTDYTVTFSDATITMKVYANDGVTELVANEGVYQVETAGTYYAVLTVAAPSNGTVTISGTAATV